MNEQYRTEKEIAEFLQISRSTMNRLRMEGGLPYYQVGRSVRFRMDEIEQWLTNNRHAQTAARGESNYEQC